MAQLTEAKQRQRLWRVFSVLSFLSPFVFIIKHGLEHPLMLIGVSLYCLAIGKLYWVWGNREAGLQRRGMRAARCWFATSLIAFMLASSVSLPGSDWSQAVFGIPIWPLLGAYTLFLLAHIVEFEAVWECRSDSLGYYIFLLFLIAPFLVILVASGYLSQIWSLDLVIVFHAAALLFLLLGFLMSVFEATSKISASSFQVCVLCSFGSELCSLWFSLLP